jgi:hypothetical protein
VLSARSSSASRGHRLGADRGAGSGGAGARTRPSRLDAVRFSSEGTGATGSSLRENLGADFQRAADRADRRAFGTPWRPASKGSSATSPRELQAASGRAADGTLEQARLARRGARNKSELAVGYATLYRGHGRRVRAPQGRVQDGRVPPGQVPSTSARPRADPQTRRSTGARARSCGPTSWTRTRCRLIPRSTACSRSTSSSTAACEELMTDGFDPDASSAPRLDRPRGVQAASGTTGVKLRPKAFGRDRRSRSPIDGGVS